MCNRRDFDVDVDAPWPDSLGADRSSSNVEQLSQVPGLRHLSIRWLFAMQFLIAAKKCIPALTFFLARVRDSRFSSLRASVVFASIIKMCAASGNF